MTDATSHQPPPVREDLAALLDQLEGALARQLEFTRADRFAAAGKLGARVDTLLVAINTHRPEALSRNAVSIARIRTLRNTLELALAQRKDEYSRHREGMGRGKRLLRAYGQQARTDHPRGSM
ncbi:MAG: hypothetical protein ISS78_06970 [Phycisphaerae bacterium]|nr:hypothetical protein [Phycisphaerae bacterium]